MIAEIKRGPRDGEGRRPRYGTKHWGALCSHSCMNTEAMRPPKFGQPAVRRNYPYFDNGMSNIDAIPLWVTAPRWSAAGGIGLLLGTNGNAKVSASGRRDCLKVLSALVAAVRHPAAEGAL